METPKNKYLPRHKLKPTDIAQKQSQKTSQPVIAIKIK